MCPHVKARTCAPAVSSSAAGEVVIADGTVTQVAFVDIRVVDLAALEVRVIDMRSAQYCPRDGRVVELGVRHVAVADGGKVAGRSGEPGPRVVAGGREVVLPRYYQDREQESREAEDGAGIHRVGRNRRLGDLVRATSPPFIPSEVWLTMQSLINPRPRL